VIPAAIQKVTLDRFEHEYRDFHTIPAALDHWAACKPDEAAIVNATRGTHLTWGELQRGSIAVAGALARLGFRKGDFLATSLPLLNELVMLEYACFRLGVIHAPLDLRLQPAEVLRSIGLIRARGFAFAAGGIGEEVRARADSVERLIQFAAPADCIAGATPFGALLAEGESGAARVGCAAGEHDPAQVIFTTGSTGSPKPALLSHRGITCQNLCLGTAFGFGPSQRVLCNLPASHVGGQAEVLLTSLFMGGTTVTLEVFDPAKSLDAIEHSGVTLIGQIPAMFQMEWRTADYARRNLAGLETAVYGGQAVPRPFLDRMLEMAPRIGTGLGLTETSGFCTYTELTADAAAVERGVGWAMPAYPLAIRGPMAGDRSAGAEMPPGEIGHVCFRGPQNFLGYVGDPGSTAAALSTDGWLYTGDMGFADEYGLHLRGRAKWLLKPAGYQVFPADIENHISGLAQVASVGVVGHEHRIWTEGIVAFVEKRPGAELSDAELKKHARSLTSYMRPLHYVILEPGAMPLNRAAKVDVVRLQELAGEEVRRLRERGRWDG
jgi:fatty-acyl-CoA synthase